MAICGPPELTTTVCADEAQARSLALELKDRVLRNQIFSSHQELMNVGDLDGGWSFRMGECFSGSMAGIEISKYSTDNGFIDELEPYVKFKGFECTIVKPVGAATIKAKTHELPTPEQEDSVEEESAEDDRSENALYSTKLVCALLVFMC